LSASITCIPGAIDPFTDNVELTGADRRSYANQAEAQRSKAFEDVDVTFNPTPGDADLVEDGPAETN
jgi:hypothetical protein